MASPNKHRDEHLPPRTRRILHLDVDAFLASVEQAVHPELRGRPLIVGGSPRSRNLVMSCSYEARARGVRPGMMSREAARLCPEAIFREGDSQAANAKREEIVRLLLGYSPRVEVASIDDFFVDLSGATRLLGCAWEIAAQVRQRIEQECALPMTIGIGTSRTMARLAGKLAKPGGIAEIWPGHEGALLDRLPVEHLPGVGRSIGKRLAEFAIRTAGELAIVPREVLYASFGGPGLAAHARACGIDDDPVRCTHHLDDQDRLICEPPQSIRRDSTFEPEEARREQVQAMLAYLVDRAAARLRSHDLLCASMEVRLYYVDTRTKRERQARRSSAPADARAFNKRRRLQEASDATIALTQHAQALLAEIPRRRALVKRIGITLLNLHANGGWQGQLFSDPALDSAQGGRLESAGQAPISAADRQRRIDEAIDRLRKRHGFGRILRGSSVPLKESHRLGPDGFQLRTPSLNQ